MAVKNERLELKIVELSESVVPMEQYKAALDKFELANTELKFKSTQLKDQQLEITSLKSCIKIQSGDTVKVIQNMLSSFKVLEAYVQDMMQAMVKKVKFCH